MAEVDERFAVDEIDVRAVPTNVFRHAPASLRQIWSDSEADGEATSLVYGDERLTFAEAHAQVRAVAHRLRMEHGVRQSDRIAIATRNYPEMGRRLLGHGPDRRRLRPAERVVDGARARLWACRVSGKVLKRELRETLKVEAP